MLKSIDLKTALLSNAAFSGISGIGVLVLNDRLSNLMGIGQELVLPLIGFGLIVFAAFIVYHASRQVINSLQVKFIITQDLLWVVGSVVIVGCQLFDLTSMGYAAMIIVALVVAVFAYLQFRGLSIDPNEE